MVVERQHVDEAKRERIAGFIQQFDSSIRNVVKAFGELARRNADDLEQEVRIALFRFLAKQDDLIEGCFPASVVKSKLIACLGKERQRGFTYVPARYWDGKLQTDFLVGVSLTPGAAEKHPVFQIATPDSCEPDEAESILAVRDAVRSLNETEQLVIRHLFWDDRTPQQIDQSYSWPEGQAMRTCVQTVRKLKVQLQSIEATEPRKREMATYTRWTPEMLETLRREWPSTPNTSTVAAQLGVPLRACKDKAKKMGLRRVARSLPTGKKSTREQRHVRSRIHEQTQIADLVAKAAFGFN